MNPKILFNNEPDLNLLESLNKIGIPLLFGKSMKGGNERRFK